MLTKNNTVINENLLLVQKFHKTMEILQKTIIMKQKIL